MTKLFVCYSHKDRHWLDRLLVHLKPLEKNGLVDAWADTRIKPGENWADRIEEALHDARVAVLLVSADFLASEFITSKELPALLQSAMHGDCKVIPLVVGPCLFSQMRDLQPFQAINAPDRPLSKVKKVEAEEVFVKLAQTILELTASSESTRLSIDSNRPLETTAHAGQRPRAEFVGDPVIDEFISGVGLGDWDSAARAALRVVAETNSEGRNQVFEALLDYQDCPDDDDRLWGALHTVECCVRLAPRLIHHDELSRMAAHKNFSVRSSAASICMDLAHSAPDRVPIDIVLKLSVCNEDWYVEAPANAALKAMARSVPDVLHVFYERLHSASEDERAHAASAIEDVAKSEAGLLQPGVLSTEIASLKRLGDTNTLRRIQRVLSKAKAVRRVDRYRYGL